MKKSIEQIQNLIDKDLLEEAETKARELLGENQDSLEVKTTLARILVIRNKNTEAIELLKNIIEQDSENYYPLYLLAFIRESQEEFDSALDYYNQALKLKQNNGRVYFQIGKVYNNPKYPGKNEYSALYNFRNAITGENPPTDAFLELASIEPPSRSIYILQKGIEKYPSDEDLNTALCIKYYSLEEYAKCVDAVDAALNHGVTTELLQCYKALAFYRLKQYREAIGLLKPIIDNVNQNDSQLKAFYGILLCEAQDYIEAGSVLKATIADDIRNSLDFVGHIILVCSYLRASNVEDAEKIFKEIPEDFNFANQNFLFIENEILDIDTYFLEAVNGLISKNTITSNKAKYFKAVYIHSIETNKGKLSTEELEQIRKEFLHAIDLLGQNNPEAYRRLYQISVDLKNWGEAIYYYFLSEILEDGDEIYSWEFDSVLESINKNQKSVDKLFSIIDRVLNEKGYLSDQFAKKCLSQLIGFFHSKEKFEIVIRLAQKFSYEKILKAKSVFEVAYAFVHVGDKKQGKKYYRAYLRDIGESSPAANNLALLEEEDGNLAEAERLSQLAVNLDPSNEKIKNNHDRILKRISDEDEKKRAYQKAADLYQQESENMRFLAAKLFSLRTEDELILYSYERLAAVSNLESDNVDFRVEEFLRKKYFDEITSKLIQFEGRILRANPAVVSMLENDLRKFEEKDALKAIINNLSSEYLDTRYGYNQSLLSNLSAIKSNELSRLLERDLYETVVALAVKSYKSALILCGSITEAVLLDALLIRKDLAIKALGRILSKEGKQLKSEDAQLDRWVLDRLLDVALETNLISENLYHWGHGLRGFRNLVHPGVEQRQSIEVSRENAEMAWNVVRRLFNEIKIKEQTLSQL